MFFNHFNRVIVLTESTRQPKEDCNSFFDVLSNLHDFKINKPIVKIQNLHFGKNK